MENSKLGAPQVTLAWTAMGNFGNLLLYFLTVLNMIEPSLYNSFFERDPSLDKKNEENLRKSGKFLQIHKIYIVFTS